MEAAAAAALALAAAAKLLAAAAGAARQRYVREYLLVRVRRRLRRWRVGLRVQRVQRMHRLPGLRPADQLQLHAVAAALYHLPTGFVLLLLFVRQCSAPATGAARHRNLHEHLPFRLGWRL